VSRAKYFAAGVAIGVMSVMSRGGLLALLYRI
jgi:hypothetical protein